MDPKRDLNSITVGCRVTLEDKRTGIVRFIGPVHFRPGVIAGIELDDPYVGTSDGSVNGWRYFDAPDSKAVFVKRAELILLDDDMHRGHSHSLGGDMTDDDIPMDTFGGTQGGNHAEPSSSFEPDDRNKRGFPTPGSGNAGNNRDRDPYGKKNRTKRGRTPTLSDFDDIHDEPFGRGGEDDDDKHARWKRGMAAALEHELLDYKSDPNDTGVKVYYALPTNTGLPYEEVTKIQKARMRNAIVKSLPDDLQKEIDPKQLKISYEDLGDYTEMKVTTDADSPEQADDLKWTMLDPIHVRKFNEELKNDRETDLINCEYTYLERRDRDGCCRWVKPCIACICCWLLLLTLLLGLLFSRLMDLNKDVDDLKNAGPGYGVSGNGTVSCDEFDICDQIKANRDAIGALQGDLDGLKDQVAANTAAIAALPHDGGGPSGDFGVTELEVVKTSIDNTGSALSRCPSEDYEIIGCWVYLPNHWWMFSTYTDPDPSGFPDCSCYCQHKDDSYGCTKIGAECRAQCAKFGLKPN